MQRHNPMPNPGERWHYPAGATTANPAAADLRPSQILFRNLVVRRGFAHAVVRSGADCLAAAERFRMGIKS